MTTMKNNDDYVTVLPGFLLPDITAGVNQVK